MKKKVLVLFVLLLSIFAGCKDDNGQKNSDKKQEVKQEKINLEQPEKVEAVKSVYYEGRLINKIFYIPEKKEMVITFYEDQEKLDFNQEKIISFEPSNVKGKYSWNDSKTLVYKIEDATFNTSYKINFAVGKYIKQDKYEDLSYYITFNTIDIIDGNVVKYEEYNDSPSRHYVVTVNLDADISENFFEENFILTNPALNDGKPLKFKNIKKVKSGKNISIFELTTENYSAENTVNSFNLKLLKKSINRYEILNGSEISNYKFKESNGKFTLYIDFDSKINLKNIKSYVSIPWLKEYTVKLKTNNYYNTSTLIIKGNFRPEKTYRVKLFKGLVSSKDKTLSILVPSLAPKLEFKSKGNYMASSLEKKLRIRTLNVGRIHLNIKKIAPENILWYSENFKLPYEKNGSIETSYWEDDALEIKYGTEVFDGDLAIGNDRNKWLESDVDLNILAEKFKEKGAYLITIDYDSDGVLTSSSSSGTISKTVIFSDLGLLVKKDDDKTIVFATDLNTGKPIKEAKITFKGKKVKTILTNDQGIVIYPEEEWDNIVGETSTGITLITSNSYIDYSLADNTGTIKKDEMTSYIYATQGVYRPGNVVNLTAILYENDKKLPENQKIIMEVLTPKGDSYKKIEGKYLGNSVYTFKFKTNEADLTGKWRGNLYLGVINDTTKIGSKEINIETIVPPKIKAEAKITETEKGIKVGVSSEYLFGAPAKDLKFNVSVRKDISTKTFKNYRKYNFVDQFFGTLGSRDSDEGVLDENGKGSLNFNFNLDKAPYRVDFKVKTEVFQRDGRKLIKNDVYTYDLYDEYVGVEKSNQSIDRGTIINLGTVAITKTGEEVKRKLIYKIYQNESYWWWDYDSYSDYMSHYKTSDDTVVIEEGEINSGEDIKFIIPSWDDFYVEVINPETGQKAGTFLSWWGSDSGKKDVSFITLKKDKPEYTIGDKMAVKFDSPASGISLISLESGSKVIKTFKQEVVKGENTLNIDVTKDMFPGVYVNVIVIQNIKEKENDKPIKLQGLEFVKVKDKEKIVNLDLEVKDIYKDAKNISVKIKGLPNMTYTLAAVDTGILSLTNYKTPNPYNFFYQKERYQINNYDNYGRIIDFENTDAYKTFKPGGGMALRDSAKKAEKALNKKPRFKLASEYRSGTTDENGEATVNLSFDDYMGEIKFMLVGVKGNKFGTLSKASKVRDDVVLVEGAPRFLTPKDEAILNYTAILNEKMSSNSILGIKVEGPLEVLGDDKVTLDGSKKGELVADFRVRAKNEIGQGKITYYFKSGSTYREKIVNIYIQSQGPYTKYKENLEIKKNSKTVFDAKKEAIKNTSTSKILISREPLYDLYGRLQYLIKYPYGCVEQTTSSVFPQLYLKNMINLTPEMKKEVDKNINAGIKRLTRFQLPNGSMSYWIGEKRTSEWGTNYVYNFFIEAKNMGYYVPDKVMNSLRNYQKNKVLSERKESLVNLQRLFLLSLDNRPQVSIMNYYKQNSLRELDDTELILLAGAYNKSGNQGVAMEILKNVDLKNLLKVQPYKDYWYYNFGSDLRDKSLALIALNGLFYEDQQKKLLKLVLEKLDSDSWYSTQTTAYALLAINTVKKTNNNNESLSVKYVIDGKSYTENFTTENTTIDITEKIKNSNNKKVTFINNNNKDLYANYYFEGKMDLRSQSEYSNGLGLKVSYFDEDGNEIKNMTELKKGQSIWAIYTVSKDRYDKYNNIALTQNLPSGLEIENTRLNNDELPRWLQDTEESDLPEWMTSSKVEVRYTDIRDDRVSWFFDLDDDYYWWSDTRNMINLIVKFNVVTKGKFYMPGATLEVMYNDEVGAGLKGYELEVK